MSSLAFPSRSTLFSRLSACPFAEDYDVQTRNLVSIIAKSFANRTVEFESLEKQVILMLKDYRVQPLGCGVENYLLIQEIVSALKSLPKLDSTDTSGILPLKRQRTS